MATKLTDEAWLRREYIDKCKSAQVIADEMGVALF